MSGNVDNHFRMNIAYYIYSRFSRFRGQRVGFTLLEVALAIGVMVLLAAIGLVSFVNSRNVRDVTASGQNIISILRLAQAKTLGGEGDDAWGVRLEQGQTILFQGASYAAASATTTYALPQALEIANINLSGGGQEIVFKRLTGYTDTSGTFEVRARSATSIAFSATVDASGKAYQTGTAPVASNTRITDTRHRTFNLGWSIQGYATTTLTFSDSPNPDTIKEISMSSYFNATSSKFDWSGTYSVGGRDQSLRIHTLSLTGISTLLSVDRDCRYNTKKVKIAIGVREIATYEADCTTVTPGAYGGTMSEP